MADGLIPEPLRHFMEVYLHPEVVGEDWEECVDSYLESSSTKPFAPVTSHEQYVSLTKDKLDTQEELEGFFGRCERSCLAQSN